ncbi:hypothetical protein W97_07994 [Coniosporium apollinis CBS 100218]|uniref:Enoyl reductase (ER) domain-containing protein n=1 Tax=Coniosporium apollinis (strain CBS 100218) TaxID=1168221 RepID=R7Z489_CONA1|nr:uncharacterized protein W97_07994 [Coniosporium apollinis CBS 100218]EON68736.1 hypothetical protein W97_07994 [Coniosporium apollinis CBS 100218]
MAPAGGKQARVYRFNEYGGPEKLQLKEEEVPYPSAGHVRVRVEAMSLNNADSLFLANQYLEPPALPSKIGYEIAGTVDAIGEGVKQFSVGDRVSAIPAFSVAEYANFAELTVLPERALMHTPRNLDKIQAASFTFAYFTNYYGLFDLGQLKPFQTVLITAASSTTGLAAISMVRAAGSTVIATSRSSAKADALKKAGANYVIATAEEDLVERVHAITGGKGVDIAYDCIAGPMSEAIVNCVRQFGHWVVYGAMDSSPVPFPVLQLMVKTVKLDTFMVFDFTGHPGLNIPANDQALARAMEYVSRGIESGALPIVVDKVFEGLEGLPDALRRQQKGTGTGKIVVEL